MSFEILPEIGIEDHMKTLIGSSRVYQEVVELLLSRHDIRIAGGSVLSAYANFEPEDVDIFVNVNSMPALYQLIKNMSEKYGYIVTNFTPSFDSIQPNGVISKLSLHPILGNGKTIEFLVTNLPTLESVQKFDISFTRCYWDGVAVYSERPIQIENKVGFISKEYSSYLLETLSQNVQDRIRKYDFRGFTVQYYLDETDIIVFNTYRPSNINPDYFLLNKILEEKILDIDYGFFTAEFFNSKGDFKTAFTVFMSTLPTYLQRNILSSAIQEVDSVENFMESLDQSLHSYVEREVSDEEVSDEEVSENLGEFNDGCDDGDVEIPYGYTSIGESAFDWCISLTSVVIPDTVTNIGYAAFRYCEFLYSVSIGNSVIRIEDNAFESCKSLPVINIPNSVTDIGDYVFYGCQKLQIISLPRGINIGQNAIPSHTRIIYRDIQQGISQIPNNVKINSMSKPPEIVLNELPDNCLDFIEGDNNITEYLEDADNGISIISGTENNYKATCFEKSNLKTLLLDPKGGNLYYECRYEDNQSSAKLNQAYFKLTLITGNIYIPVEYVVFMLNDEENSLYYMQPLNIEIEYSISVGLHSGADLDMVSAYHCQEGSNLHLGKLLPIQP